MSDIRFGPSDKEPTPEQIVARAKELLKAMSMDQQQTFTWMRNRIYDELEPEVARLKSELTRKDAALREGRLWIIAALNMVEGDGLPPNWDGMRAYLKGSALRAEGEVGMADERKEVLRLIGELFSKIEGAQGRFFVSDGEVYDTKALLFERIRGRLKWGREAVRIMEDFLRKYNQPLLEPPTLPREDKG